VQGWNIAVQQVKDHQNRFPLLGAHAAVQCDDCHKSAAVGQFQGLSTACISCHLKDYQQTQTMGGNVPNHVTANFPSTCESCHTFDSWVGGKFNGMNFDHAAPPISFPLTNGHANVPCTSCHVGNNYNLQIVATDCGHAGCHLTTWQQTTNPQHSAAATVFPIAMCSTCHNTVSWQNANFNHATTGFPLTNSHQLAPAGKVASCTDCHINNNYNLQIQPTDCGNSQCHLNTNYGGGWQGTTNPVHSTAGAPFAAANCSNCHNTVSFLTAIFNHAATGWPLVGSHQLVPVGKVNACTDCHVGNNYNLTAANTDCYGCHQTAWNSTTAVGGNVPNHLTSFAGLQSMCSTCHDTVLWSDGKFDHSATGFPLQGPHMLPPRTTVTGAIGPMVNACTDCHIGGNYTTGYPTTDCYGCHQTYYTNAQTYDPSVPNHVTANYGTGCIACHTTWVTQAWLGATFNHTFFRLPHPTKGVAGVCSDCHINANNYKQFSCENCHTYPTAHRPGMSHDNVCSPSPACWYNPPTRCYDCHKG
jgi:hypothetical protein